MPFSRSLTVIGCHCEGEVGDVITGGVLDVPGKTMFEKLQYMSTQKDDLRQLLLNEPRGRASINTNLVLPPCDPSADAGFLIMESEEYPPMSGSNTICTATVLLETGMVPMKEPVTHLALDTAAGLIKVTAECEAGKCKSVEFDNIASFVFELDFKVKVRGLGEVSVDIAYGGMMYVVTDATALGLRVDNQDATRLIDIGERIKRAVEAVYTPVHPENPGIKGFSVIVFTEPLRVEGGCKVASNATVVPRGDSIGVHVALGHPLASRSFMQEGKSREGRPSSIGVFWALNLSAGFEERRPSANIQLFCLQSKAARGLRALKLSFWILRIPSQRAFAWGINEPKWIDTFQTNVQVQLQANFLYPSEHGAFPIIAHAPHPRISIDGEIRGT
ncbi:hypothetical protein N7468_001513 [Penicillium chermesinum]|uniref:Proline racemase n=1 Tax=Penicillium chermesinum TaxID=63820 RepID=A0A9W9PGT2_9EURO|nr:uncharacterized protein N7468_001513 [Penicillium chermesinum]KAJ5246530.1 hypothetical protein N7468_001513 [Penicillium chermesinum]